ncbi:MAG: AAA family ATPase, partial [Elusimicrobiota bacterium]
EYQEPHSVSRMIGAPPGYVGHDDGGHLVEEIRRRPYSVVLLDEVEKAHPDVLNTLLQILEDGELTDGQGRKANFRHTIIIMTANVGSHLFGKKSVGFKRSGAPLKSDPASDVRAEAKKRFKPEFLNRLDDIIVFDRLSQDNIRKITDLEVDKLAVRLKTEHGITLSVSAQARDLLARKGFDEEYGARPLRRAMQDLLETPLAEVVLKSGQHNKPSTLTADLAGDGQSIAISAMPASKSVNPSTRSKRRGLSVLEIPALLTAGALATAGMPILHSIATDLMSKEFTLTHLVLLTALLSVLSVIINSKIKKHIGPDDRLGAFLIEKGNWFIIVCAMAGLYSDALHAGTLAFFVGLTAIIAPHVIEALVYSGARIKGAITRATTTRKDLNREKQYLSAVMDYKRFHATELARQEARQAAAPGGPYRAQQGLLSREDSLKDGMAKLFLLNDPKTQDASKKIALRLLDAGVLDKRWIETITLSAPLEKTRVQELEPVNAQTRVSPDEAAALEQEEFDARLQHTQVKRNERGFAGVGLSAALAAAALGLPAIAHDVSSSALFSLSALSAFSLLGAVLRAHGRIPTLKEALARKARRYPNAWENLVLVGD